MKKTLSEVTIPPLPVFYLESIPKPPASEEFHHLLRWCIAVMNEDDPQFAFCASLLSHAVKFSGLTERQAYAGNKMINRIIESYGAGTLDMQMVKQEAASKSAIN